MGTPQIPSVDSDTKQFPDSIRARIASNFGDLSSVEGAALAALIGSSLPQTVLGHGRTILLGDSTDAGTTGDGVPGSWINYLSVLSNARVRLVRNAGIGGNTTTQMLARIQADVIAYKPDICILGGPTNDHSQGIPETTTRQNYADMVTALRKAGIRIVIRNCWPCDTAGSSSPWNTVALRRQVIQRHNAWLRVWADIKGIPVLDVYSATVDPATGGLRSAIAGDGTHPNHLGYLAAANAIISAGLPNVFASTPALPAASFDNAFLSYNASADPLMSSSTGWSATLAGSTSLVADPTVVGQGLRVTSASDTTGTAAVDARTTTFVLGHRYAYVARVKATSGGFRLRGATWGGDASATSDMGTLTAPVTGTAYVEAVASGTGTSTLRLIASAPTVGVMPDFQIAQAGIIDLTALGVA